MSKLKNPLAFPRPGFDTPAGYEDGMTLRDSFAGQAPAVSDSMIARERDFDSGRNPHNEPHRPKLRSRAEIIAELAYDYAEAMLAERQRRL